MFDEYIRVCSFDGMNLACRKHQNEAPYETPAKGGFNEERTLLECDDIVVRNAIRDV